MNKEIEKKTLHNRFIIWRYMDLWKFLDIIDNNRLYMTRLDRVEDKYEANYYNKFINSSIMSRSKKHNVNINSDEITKAMEHNKKYIYMSCWTNMKTENYLLWKAYTNYTTGIVIKSNGGNLLKSINNSEKRKFLIKKIMYINTEKKDENEIFSDYDIHEDFSDLLFLKRDYFKHEQEYRMITYFDANTDSSNKNTKPSGLYIEIDPKILIKEVYVSPGSSDEFKKLVQLKVDKLKFGIEVKKSGI